MVKYSHLLRNVLFDTFRKILFLKLSNLLFCFDLFLLIRSDENITFVIEF